MKRLFFVGVFVLCLSQAHAVECASQNGAAVSDMALKISDKDNETTYNEAESKLIDLSSATGPVKITEAGTYIVTGKTDDGMIIVDVDGESDDVHLILRDAVINSSSSAAVYVLSADEVYITLEGNNILSNGGKYEAIDENDIDSVGKNTAFFQLFQYIANQLSRRGWTSIVTGEDDYTILWLEGRSKI